MYILDIIKNYISNFFKGIEEKHGGLSRESTEEYKIKKPFKCTSKKIRVPEKIIKVKERKPTVIKHKKLNLEFYPIHEAPKARVMKQQDSCQLKYN